MKIKHPPTQPKKSSGTINGHQHITKPMIRSKMLSPSLIGQIYGNIGSVGATGPTGSPLEPHERRSSVLRLRTQFDLYMDSKEKIRTKPVDHAESVLQSTEYVSVESLLYYLEFFLDMNVTEPHDIVVISTAVAEIKEQIENARKDNIRIRGRV